MNRALERLGLSFVERHPRQAALVFESLEPRLAAEFLASAPADHAAGMLEQINPGLARSFLSDLPAARIGEIVARMPVMAGAGILRQVPVEKRTMALQGLGPEKSRTLTQVLHFASGAVGAIMDPHYPAFPASMTNGDLIERLQADELKGISCVFALDRSQSPIGVIRTHDVFLSDRTGNLSAGLTPCAYRLHGNTEWKSVADNSDLRLWSVLPVIDEEGRYIGALREDTVIQLSNDSSRARAGDSWRRTSLALGEVFRLGLGGVLDTIDQTRK